MYLRNSEKSVPFPSIKVLLMGKNQSVFLFWSEKIQRLNFPLIIIPILTTKSHFVSQIN
jgi:hypothetical protein